MRAKDLYDWCLSVAIVVVSMGWGEAQCATHVFTDVSVATENQPVCLAQRKNRNEAVESPLTGELLTVGDPIAGAKCPMSAPYGYLAGFGLALSPPGSLELPDTFVLDPVSTEARWLGTYLRGHDPQTGVEVELEIGAMVPGASFAKVVGDLMVGRLDTLRHTDTANTQKAIRVDGHEALRLDQTGQTMDDRRMDVTRSVVVAKANAYYYALVMTSPLLGNSEAAASEMRQVLQGLRFRAANAPPLVTLPIAPPVSNQTYALGPIAPRAAPPMPVSPRKVAPISMTTSCPNIQSIIRNMQYPPAASRRGINGGDVMAHFTIGPDGRPTNVQYDASNKIFMDAAADMVNQLQCSPDVAGIAINWPIQFLVVP